MARRAGLYVQSATIDRAAWGEVLAEGEVLAHGVAPVERPQSAGPLSQGALFDQLISTTAALGREQPLLLLFDDLHWVDDASAAFLLRVGRELRGCRVLVLGAYRSATVAIGRRDPLSGEMGRHPLATVVNELRRCNGEIPIDLDRADGRAFVEAYVNTEPNRLGATLAYSAVNRWFLGHSEKALARSRQAMAGARAEEAVVGQPTIMALGASLLFFTAHRRKGHGRIWRAGPPPVPGTR